MLRINQEFTVQTSPQTLWDFLLNVEQVAACMPGVEQVEQVDERTYQARMSVRIGPIKATFSGDVEFVELHPPHKMEIRAVWHERYTSSKADVKGTVELHELAEGGVKCVVDVQAEVLGALGKYGQGIAQRKATEINESFSGCVRAVLEEQMTPEAAFSAVEAPTAVAGRFAYFRPGSVAETIDLLQQYGDEAKLIAGGQSLILMMREGLVQPAALINLMDLSGLKQIQADDSRLKIGALVTHRQIERLNQIEQRLPFIAEAYKTLASPQVRNMGTLGGNLCHNAPGSDPPAWLIILDATVTIQGPAGRRTLPVEQFGTDFYENALEAAEILTEINLPFLPPRSGAVYQKYAIRPMDMAIVGAAARITLADDNTCREARLALSGVAPTTRSIPQAEEVLRGAALSEAVIAEAAQIALDQIDPISDLHASAAYRRQITPIAVRRALTLAWQQAQEEK